jgi:hypothetical protein
MKILFISGLWGLDRTQFERDEIGCAQFYEIFIA